MVKQISPADRASWKSSAATAPPALRVRPEHDDVAAMQAVARVQLRKVAGGRRGLEVGNQLRIAAVAAVCKASTARASRMAKPPGSLQL